MSICVEGEKEDFIHWFRLLGWEIKNDQASKKGTVIHFTQRGDEVIITTLSTGWYRETDVKNKIIINFN
jgi:uncharacterized protein with PIN domain